VSAYDLAGLPLPFDEHERQGDFLRNQARYGRPDAGGVTRFVPTQNLKDSEFAVGSVAQTSIAQHSLGVEGEEPFVGECQLFGQAARVPWRPQRGVPLAKVFETVHEDILVREEVVGGAHPTSCAPAATPTNASRQFPAIHRDG